MTVGKDVTRFRPGDEVFGDMTEFGYGAFAKYVAAPERAFAPIPSGITLEGAATVPQGAILAIQGLQARRPVRTGNRVLINGASGSVGPWAVQIAKALGAEVTGVASTKKHDFVRSLGADHVVDYTREDFTRLGHRYDRIIDVTATRSVSDIRRALSLRDNGRRARHLGDRWPEAGHCVLEAVQARRRGEPDRTPGSREDQACDRPPLPAR
ncbi:MAG: NAD(P)-dependent alcohol dehydrogenase [Candidatus Limnocylindria bacterium]